MFEEETIGVTCKKCGHEGQESVASLKTDGYTCPKCGASYDSNQLALKQVEGSFARFSDSQNQLTRAQDPVEIWFGVMSDLRKRAWVTPLKKEPLR